MTLWYVLDARRRPVPCPDAQEWAAWMETADRRVALDQLADGVEVSTVFLGLDHGFGYPPKLYETLVFGGPLDGGEMRRYTTEGEALAGHRAVVGEVMLALYGKSRRAMNLGGRE